MRPRGATWLALSAALMLAGCASGGESPPDPFDPSATMVSILVRNQYGHEVILHAYGPATRARLGMVAPGRSASFQVPWIRPEELRIRVEPATGPHMESNALTVRPGDQVVFTVASDIGRSVLIYR